MIDAPQPSMATLVDMNGVAPDHEVPARQVLVVGREQAEALFVMLARAIGACEKAAKTLDDALGDDPRFSQQQREHLRKESLAYKATSFGLTGLNNDILIFLRANGWRPNG